MHIQSSINAEVIHRSRQSMAASSVGSLMAYMNAATTTTSQ